MQDFIERRIITGLIISKDYLDRVQSFWDVTLLESPEFRKVASWCMDYYNKYNRAPDSDIEAIYMEKLQAGQIHKAEAEYIETVLNDLSDEYGRDTQFNSAYLYDQTVQYFKSQKLAQHNEQVQALIDEGKVEEAEKLAQSYEPTVIDKISVGLELSSEEALERIEHAFSEASQTVLSYPGALGEMWNEHLVRGGFFAFLAPEKRGKTFWMLELAMRSIRQKANVAFFQAGDMTETQQLKRISVYLARRSEKDKYCQPYFHAVGDCVFNQLDQCDRNDRNCDHGIFEGVEYEDFMKSYHKFINIDVLAEKYRKFEDYEPCDSYTCNERKGSVWVKYIPKRHKLTAKKARQEVTKFFKKYKRRFKLATYPSDTLTVHEIKEILDEWEKQDQFVPDVIIVDYADLLTSNVKEFRHKQDDIWKNLRGLSQERHCLVITATQADADSYKKGRLALSNFSEDKRKYAHVTAMYGLNQDPQGREKKLGIMRINELVIREGEFSNDNEVKVIQDLRQGRTFLESFK